MHFKFLNCVSGPSTQIAKSFLTSLQYDGCIFETINIPQVESEGIRQLLGFLPILYSA